MTQPQSGAGRIRIDLSVGADGAVGEVEIHSDRPVDACRIVHGLTPVEAVGVIPALFAVCGRAQGVAALRCLEAAQERPADPDQEVARTLLCLGEAALGHGWHQQMDLPRVIGRVADMGALRSLVSALAALEAALFPGRRFTAPVDGTARDPIAVNAASRDVAEALLACLDRAQDALEVADSLGVADQGRFDGCQAPDLDPAAVAVSLADRPDYAFRPRLDGAVAEVGPNARVGEGRDLAARLASFAAEAREIAAMLTGHAALPDPAVWGRSAEASAVVRTARGPLAHWVRLEGERIADYRTLAPTEWHFRPRGPVELALRTSTLGPRPTLAAELVAASFDACVPVRCRVIQEVGHA